MIPAVVRTLIPSQIIQQYMQKSLQGLNNVTAEGTEAIDNLPKMIETLVENGA